MQMCEYIQASDGGHGPRGGYGVEYIHFLPKNWVFQCKLLRHWLKGHVAIGDKWEENVFLLFRLRRRHIEERQSLASTTFGQDIY
jgi:hypothetical protein